MGFFKKKLILELAASLIILIFLLGILFFLKNNISNYTKKTIEAKEQLKYLTEGVTLLAKLQDQYKIAKNYQIQIENTIPKYYDLIKIQQDLRSLATKESLSFSFNFGEEKQNQNSSFGTINFNMTVSSPETNNIINFLKDFQNFKYLTKIEDVSFSKTTENTTLKIKGDIFYKK